MKKILINFKKSSLTFILLNIYITIMIFLPKHISIFNNLPIRSIMTFLLILVILYEIYIKKLELNNYKNIGFKIVTLLFFVSAIPSLFVTKSLIVSLYTIFKFFTIFLLFFLLSKIKFSKREYYVLLRNFLIVIFIFTIIGLIQYILGVNLHIKDSGIEYYPGAKGRLNGTFFNTVYYGIFINLVFALAFYLLNKAKEKKHIVFLTLLCILLCINLIFTFTRSAIFVFIAIIILFIILLNKLIFNKRSLVVLLAFIISIGVIPGARPLIKKTFIDALKMGCDVASFLPGIEIELPEFLLFDENSEFTDYSLQHRKSFATMAKKIASDNILTGVGIGSYLDYMNSEDFDNKYPKYTLSKITPHSSMLLYYSECGILGLIAFSLCLFGFLLIAISQQFKYYKKDNIKFQLSSILFMITSGFVVVNIMSENAIYDTQIAYIFITIYGLLMGYIYSTDEEKKVLFISSTGGHLNELLQLTPLIKKYDSYIITEKTKSNISLKNRFNNVNYLVYGTKKNLFNYIFIFGFNILKSLYYFMRIRPNVVITTGTHTAVPMCYIAKLFGQKVIFIETFANSKTKTMSGKLVYPIADTFIVQWESMLKLYPKAVLGGWIY